MAFQFSEMTLKFQSVLSTDTYWLIHIVVYIEALQNGYALHKKPYIMKSLTKWWKYTFFTLNIISVLYFVSISTTADWIEDGNITSTTSAPESKFSVFNFYIYIVCRLCRFYDDRRWNTWDHLCDFRRNWNPSILFPKIEEYIPRI